MEYHMRSSVCEKDIATLATVRESCQNLPTLIIVEVLVEEERVEEVEDFLVESVSEDPSYTCLLRRNQL